MIHCNHDERVLTEGLTPLLILDYRVLVWKVKGVIEKHNPEDFEDQGTLDNFIRASWAYLINSGITFLSRSYTLVIVDDSKPYWREDYLKPYGIVYKGGRPEKTAIYDKIAETGLNYITAPKSPYYYFSKRGYEADDWAGQFCKLKKLLEEQDSTSNGAKRLILLHTLDTDWLQLVSDSVLWVNTAHWLPKIRGNKEAIEWAKKRLRVSINKAHDIARIKSIQGDKSDNLPPNSPLEVIDLLNPAYTLDTENDRLLACLNDVRPLNIKSHLENSQKFIQSKGLILPQ